MVGNDIVDLKYAALESNWQRKGFLNKVFNTKEIDYIEKSEQPFLLVWKLWSMKESAYKINMQQYKHRFFNPKKLECTLLDDSQGFVEMDNDCYKTFSTQNKTFIHTVAVLKKVDYTQSDSFKIEGTRYVNQRQTCHSRLKKAISNRLHVKSDTITIKKSIFGIPKLYMNGNLLGIDCSMTHHGNYGAYAISCKE